jgi:CarD family transcriptional regulator
MMRFRVGDKAVYPTQGVAEVVGVEEKEISGSTVRFYSLQMLETGLRILVPVDKAEQVGLRQVVGEPQVREVFAILKEKDVPIDKQTWNRRYRGFMDKLKTGSLFEVAEVYRDLSRLKASKALSFGERKMLDAAKGLLLKELSIARKTTENKLEGEIEQLFL